MTRSEVQEVLSSDFQLADTNVFSLADSDQSRQLDFSKFSVLRSEQGRIWKRFARMDKDGDQHIIESEFQWTVA